jgi:hypothetical protein
MYENRQQVSVQTDTYGYRALTKEPNVILAAVLHSELELLNNNCHATMQTADAPTAACRPPPTCVGVAGARLECSQCRVEEQAAVRTVLRQLQQHRQVSTAAAAAAVAAGPISEAGAAAGCQRLLLLPAVLHEELLACAPEQQRGGGPTDALQEAEQLLAQQRQLAGPAYERHLGQRKQQCGSQHIHTFCLPSLPCGRSSRVRQHRGSLPTVMAGKVLPDTPAAGTKAGSEAHQLQLLLCG